MRFCACTDPERFAGGVCLACGLLHERAALSFLTAADGAHFSLHTISMSASADVVEFLRVAKARLLDVMRERLAEIRG